MYEEFHKRFSHQLARPAAGRKHVDEAVEREQHRHLGNADESIDNALAPESGQSLVPDR